MDRAHEDLETAEYNLAGKKLGMAEFLAQQAAEKAFKALLLERRGRFPRTHDLTALAESTEAPEPMLAHCLILEPAYVSYRYPDAELDLDAAEAGKLLGAAKEVVEWVRLQLS